MLFGRSCLNACYLRDAFVGHPLNHKHEYFFLPAGQRGQRTLDGVLAVQRLAALMIQRQGFVDDKTKFFAGEGFQQKIHSSQPKGFDDFVFIAFTTDENNGRLSSHDFKPRLQLQARQTWHAHVKQDHCR